jgi:hypothetical protein
MLNSAEAAESGASFSVFSALSAASAVQPRRPGQVRADAEKGYLDWVYKGEGIRGDYLRGIGYSEAMRLIFLAVLLVLP